MYAIENHKSWMGEPTRSTWSSSTPFPQVIWLACMFIVQRERKHLPWFMPLTFYFNEIVLTFLVEFFNAPCLCTAIFSHHAFLSIFVTTQCLSWKHKNNFDIFPKSSSSEARWICDWVYLEKKTVPKSVHIMNHRNEPHFYMNFWAPLEPTKLDTEQNSVFGHLLI